MQNLLKYLPWITTAILLIVLWGSVTKCSKNKEMLDEEQAYTEKFSIEKTKDGKQIALQAENIISNKKLIKSLSDTISSFKKITQQTKFVLVTKVVEVEVPIKDYVYIKDSVGNSYLKTPANFSYEDKDKWFALKGTITDKGTIQMREMTYRNSLSIYAGWKKRTLKDIFKKRERQIGVVDLNPSSTVSKLSNFTIKEKEHRISIGLQAGYGLTTKGFLPYAGLGIQLRLF
jgi:hypothetical protein